MNPKNKVDNLITRAIEANINEGISKEIALDKEWIKFKRKYFPQRSFFYLQKGIAIIIPILFGVGFLLSLLFPMQAKAISSKSLEFFKSFMVGKVQAVSTDYANKSSIEKSLNSLSPEIIEKIQSVPFKVLLPIDYLEEYHVDSLIVNKLGDSTDVVIKLVANDNRKVTVQQTNITQGFSQGISFDNEDAILKKIRISGQEATLITYKKQAVFLTWVDGDVFISMDGNIGKDEMLQLGSSMRRLP